MAIGRIALGWTRCENEFRSTIAGILGRTSRGEDGGWGISPNWIASLFLAHGDAKFTLERIARRLFAVMLESNATLSVWEDLSRRYIDLDRKRGEIVHGEWAWSEHHPDHIIQVKRDGSLHRWSEGDLLDVSERMTALELEMHLFMKAVLVEIHERRITAYVTADMIIS
jgi:hypothetical protein